MQKWLLIAMLFLLSACSEPDIRYDASEARIAPPVNNSLYARVNIDLKEKHFTTPLGVKVHSFGAFEVFWDGTRLGQNGIPGTPTRAEAPGTETSYYQVPDALSGLGKHVVELKGTQVHLNEMGRSVMVKPESYLGLLRRPLIDLAFVNLMAGAFLIAAFYYVFLYLNSQAKTKTTLLFALICILFFALLVMEYIKFTIDIPYTRFYWRLSLVGWLTFAIAVLIPFYFIIHFKLPRPALLTALLASVLLFIYVFNYGHYDHTAHLYSLTWWISSVLVVIYACIKKRKGSLLVLQGLLLSMLISRYMYYDFSLYIAFTIILLCILYLQTNASRQLELAHRESQLLSSRLQLELVKKNIQPHFLRNTLTSLMDWIEETPAEGVKMIKALSGEFDLMMEMSEASLVPIRQEIDLCKRHLEVMQFRKEVNYVWTEEGVDETETIPPAVLLTLVENGITHNLPTENSLRFHLQFYRADGFKHYVLDCLGKSRPAGNTSGGNGFKYVKARLTESYRDNWQFEAACYDGGWRNQIQIGL
ncbi:MULTISPECIES: sensor histidine kinase [Niastella]|uniref:Histidine kinase n=1 Tax=Niastella soli TaxID=2821487 RepID=A0ABS3Z2S8_9BACT|nr:histidine kinase [Niastella soli]MBO9204328.1 histidine kinase [Niastella soli]